MCVCSVLALHLQPVAMPHKQKSSVWYNWTFESIDVNRAFDLLRFYKFYILIIKHFVLASYFLKNLATQSYCTESQCFFPI